MTKVSSVPLFILGLTGGIGAGKSTAADVFRSLGVPVIDADAISRALTAPHAAGTFAVGKAFGPDFVTADGAMNRAKMRELVFSDPTAKTRLEAILHPMIGREVERQFAALPADTPYAVFDCPLLLENERWRSFVDRILVIDLSEEEAVHRVGLRSGLSPETVRAILRNQVPRTARLAAADDILYNGSERSALVEGIKLLHNRYREGVGLRKCPA